MHRIICFGMGFLMVSHGHSLSCTDVSLSSDQSVQQAVVAEVAAEVVAELCHQATALIKPYHGRNPRLVLLQPERWQRLPDCGTKPAIRIAAMARTGKLPLEISCAGNGDGSWQQRLAARLDFDVPVLLAEKSINRGEPLSGLQPASVPFSSVTGNVLQHPDSLHRRVAARKINAGTMITAEMVKKADVLSRGQPVTIVVQSETVVLNTKGVAMERGHIGDTIRVQRENGRTLKCRVINEGEVMPVGFSRASEQR